MSGLSSLSSFVNQMVLGGGFLALMLVTFWKECLKYSLERLKVLEEMNFRHKKKINSLKKSFEVSFQTGSQSNPERMEEDIPLVELRSTINMILELCHVHDNRS